MTHQKDQKDPDELAKKLAQAQKKAAEEKAQAESGEIDNLQNEIAKLQQELEQTTELAKRTMADMQNLRRRTEEERSSIFSMGVAEFLKKILPFLDNLDRASQHVPPEAKEWYKGIELSLKDLHKTLEESGFQKMETVGKPFDPNFHEALTTGPGEKDLILEELEPGYLLNDRVVRHAKVKVGNGEKE